MTSMTTYYPGSKGITKTEIAAVSDWMAEKGLLVVSFMSFVPLVSKTLMVSGKHEAEKEF
jgi:hypothetical protein